MDAIKWTTSDPLGYAGKHVVVTGCHSGIGLATARLLTNRTERHREIAEKRLVVIRQYGKHTLRVAQWFRLATLAAGEDPKTELPRFLSSY